MAAMYAKRASRYAGSVGYLSFVASSPKHPTLDKTRCKKPPEGGLGCSDQAVIRQGLVRRDTRLTNDRTPLVDFKLQVLFQAIRGHLVWRWNV